MSLALAGRNVERVRLIDDDPMVRSGYKYTVEDMNLSPEEVTGPLGDLGTFLDSFDSTNDAVISDFHLKASNYSHFNGDELVMHLYKRHLPAVMCTRYADVLPEPVRARRRFIPVVLKSEEITAEALTGAFQVCTNEFSGIYLPTRKPWKAIIRVEGIEQMAGNLLRLNVVIPGWDLSTALSFDVPNNVGNQALAHLTEACSREEVISLFGTVNLGAERADDIYVDDWSLIKTK